MSGAAMAVDVPGAPVEEFAVSPAGGDQGMRPNPQDRMPPSQDEFSGQGGAQWDEPPRKGNKRGKILGYVGIGVLVVIGLGVVWIRVGDPVMKMLLGGSQGQYAQPYQQQGMYLPPGPQQGGYQQQQQYDQGAPPVPPLPPQSYQPRQQVQQLGVGVPPVVPPTPAVAPPHAQGFEPNVDAGGRYGVAPAQPAQEPPSFPPAAEAVGAVEPSFPPIPAETAQPPGARMNAVDAASLERLEARLASIDSRLGEIDGKVSGGQQTTVSRFEASVEALTAAINGLTELIRLDKPRSLEPDKSDDKKGPAAKKPPAKASKAEPAKPDGSVLTQSIPPRGEQELRTLTPKPAPSVEAPKAAPTVQAPPTPQPAPQASAWALRGVSADGSVAWLSRSGGQAQAYSVGQSIPELGTLRSISVKNGKWVAEATGGQVVQP